MNTILSPQQFDELAPDFLNRRLEPQLAHAMDVYLDLHPNARVHMEQLRGFQDQLRAELQMDSPDQGLERLRSRLSNEKLPRSAETERLPPGRLAPASFWNWLTIPQFRYVSIGAALVLSVQTAGLLYLSGQNTAPYSESRAVTILEQQIVRVTFRTDATEEKIRLAIASVEGRIVDGPGNLGDYFVMTPRPAQQAADRLQQLPQIESVQVVKRLPDRN